MYMDECQLNEYQYSSMDKRVISNMYNHPNITFEGNVFDNNSVYDLTIHLNTCFKCEIKVSFTFVDDCPMIIKHCLIACYTKHILQYYPENCFNDQFKNKYHQFIKSIDVNGPNIIFYERFDTIYKLSDLIDEDFYLDINDFFKKLYVEYPDIFNVDIIIKELNVSKSKILSQYYDNILKKMIIFDYNCSVLYRKIQDTYTQNPSINILNILQDIYKSNFSLLTNFNDIIDIFNNIQLFSVNKHKKMVCKSNKPLTRHYFSKKNHYVYNKNHSVYDKKHFKNYSTFMRNIH